LQTRPLKDEEKYHFVRSISEKLLVIVSDVCHHEAPSLEYYSPEMFDKLRTLELGEFILAYDPCVTLKKKMPSRKGKISKAREAIESGVSPENN